MNIYLCFIILILLGKFIFKFIIEYLNVKNMSPVLPKEFTEYYDKEQYDKSQKYLKDNTFLEMVRLSSVFVVLILTIILGLLNYIDQWIRSFHYTEIFSGILFFSVISFILILLELPLSVYKTFFIEERYNFNRTTVKTFILDTIKNLIIAFYICRSCCFLCFMVI